MSIPLHYYAPTVLPCDHLPELHELRTQVTALRAENRSLIEQLHAKEERLALYRDIDEAADRGRINPHAPLWAPEPEETTT
jgi:hypothetical protein